MTAFDLATLAIFGALILLLLSIDDMAWRCRRCGVVYERRRTMLLALPFLLCYDLIRHRCASA